MLGPAGTQAADGAAISSTPPTALRPAHGPSIGELVSEYVTITKADNKPIADLISQRLDQGGIPCVLVPGNTAAVAGAGASFAVTVPAERAEEARELLGE